MPFPRKTGFVTATAHLLLVLYFATYIARNFAHDHELPMAWVLLGLIDFPVELVAALIGSQRIMALPDWSWLADKTGLWITGKWEPFLAPLLLFSTLGTLWWFFIGWGAGHLWTFVRRHA